MNNKVLKAGFGYTIGNYLLKGLAFFTIPIFARLLNPSDYGQYNTFIAYESILFVIIGFAIHSSYKNARYKYGKVEEGAFKGQDYYSYVSTTLAMIVILLGIWLSLVNIFGKSLVKLLSLDLFSLNLLVLFAFGSAVICCFNVDVSLQYKFKSFLTVAAINAIGSIGLSIFLICTVFDNQRYLGRVIGTVLPLLIIAIYIICHYFKRAKPCNYRSFLSWGLNYSLPIVPHGISQVILSQFDRIMINSMIGSFQAGVYSFAYNIFTIVAVTSASIDNAWGPWFYEKMHEHNYEEIKQKSKFYMLFLFCFTASIILVSPELIAFLGTREYEEAVYSAVPIIAGGFFAFMYNIPASVEYYYEKTRFIAIGTVMAAIINIILNYIFINQYGYTAAAYTTLVTYLLYFYFHYFLAWKIHKSSLFNSMIVGSTSAGIIFMSFATMMLLNTAVWRWILMLCLVSNGLIYEEKKLGLGCLVKKRFIGKGHSNG